MTMGGYSAGGSYGGAPQGAGVFGPIERGRIETLGNRARLFGVLNWIVGVCTLAIGAVVLASVPGVGHAAGAFAVLGAFVPLLSGKYYVDAGRALRAVATAPGDGVQEVMEAMGLIRDALRLEAALIVVGAVVGVVLGAVGVSGQG